MFNRFLSKLRKYEIRIRKAVNGERYGNFQSIFKGSGLEFDDLRQYQYADDIRSIDWNSSAKGHGTYIKIFKEEKEQTVFFMLDVSGSQDIGDPQRLKVDTAKEICGVLTLAAIREASQVGLLCFSDKKEHFSQPRSGMKHAYSILSDLFKLQPESKATNIAGAILTALNILQRRSLVFLISDFIDSDYEHNLKALARKHDLIIIHIHDTRETDLPKLGIIRLFDTEIKKYKWINTSSSGYRTQVKNEFSKRSLELEKLCRQNNANYLSVNATDDYIPSLIRLFRIRRYVSSRI